jgi:hypothetical protein
LTRFKGIQTALWIHGSFVVFIIVVHHHHAFVFFIVTVVTRGWSIRGMATVDGRTLHTTHTTTTTAALHGLLLLGWSTHGIQPRLLLGWLLLLGRWLLWR